MSSSFQQWESDPLFSAAEIVQDSADRVESIFRHLLHEESLSKGYPDMRIQHSMDYHRRDLATILETAKWQLEDFEREVNVLAVADNSLERQNAIYRHRQFVRAIREQIMNVEKSMEKYAVVVESARKNEWINLNEQDSDGLASFLSGGSLVKNSRKLDTEGDANIFGKFLDPVGYSSINEEISEQNSEGSNMKEFGFSHPNLHLIDSESKEKDDLKLDFEAPSTQESVCRCEEEICDLEANEAKPKMFSKQNKIRSFYSQVHPFRSLRNFIPIYASAGGRSMTKKRKDGEVQTHFQSGNAFSRSMQKAFGGMMNSCSSCWVRVGMERYQISSTNSRGPSHSMVIILTVLLTLIVLGILMSKIF